MRASLRNNNDAFIYEEREHGVGLFNVSSWMEQYPELTVGLSSRIGGVSDVSGDDQGALNCAFHVVDQPANVIDNRRRLAAAIRYPFESWTSAEQVHGNRVALVTSSHRGKGKLAGADQIPSADALVTNEEDILLTAFFADCVPLYFYDPHRRAIGLAHAGWKGTALNIAQATVQAMQREFGSVAHELVAAIGPSIGVCCYEIDEPVVQQLAQAWQRAGGASREISSLLRPSSTERYMADLKEINRQFMIKAGILPINIELSGLCTSCRTEWFFSHRKELGRTGRMAAWIGLQEVGKQLG